MNNWEDILIKRLRDFRGPEVPGQEAELWQRIDTNLGTPVSSASASNSWTSRAKVAVVVVVGAGIAFLMQDNASVQPAEIAPDPSASELPNRQANKQAEELTIELDELGHDETDDSLISDKWLTPQAPNGPDPDSGTTAQSNLKTHLQTERANEVFVPAKELSSANPLVANSIVTDDNVLDDLVDDLFIEEAVPHEIPKGDDVGAAMTIAHNHPTITEIALAKEDGAKNVAIFTTEQQGKQPSPTSQEVGNSLVAIDGEGAVEFNVMIPRQLSEVAFPNSRKDLGLLSTMEDVHKPSTLFAIRVFSGPTQSRFSMTNDSGRNDFFQHDISAGAGIMIEFDGTQQWSIGMAWHEYVHSLQYTEIEETQISEYGVIGITIDTSTGDTLAIEEGVVNGLETRIRTIDHHNRFRTLSIPLEWRKVVNKGLWQCGFGIGAALQFRTAAWGSILDEEFRVVQYSNEQMSRGRMTLMPTIRAFSGLHVAPGWRFDLGLFSGIHGHKSKAVDEPLPNEFEAGWNGQLFNAQLQIGLTHFLPSDKH